MVNHAFDLQLFADAPANDGADPQPAPAPAPAGAPTPAPLTFDQLLQSGHQAEFDRRVSKAIETARAKFVDPQVADLQAKLQGYERRDTVIAAGVGAEFAEFVAYQVAGSLADGDDFADKLKTFVEAHPQYAAGAKPAASWGAPQHGNGGKTPSGVEAAFARLNPNIKI